MLSQFSRKVQRQITVNVKFLGRKFMQSMRHRLLMNLLNLINKRTQNLIYFGKITIRFPEKEESIQYLLSDSPVFQERCHRIHDIYNIWETCNQGYHIIFDKNRQILPKNHRKYSNRIERNAYCPNIILF